MHRADVVTRGAVVIELQHSPIKRDEIDQRSTAHPNLLWIVDGTDVAELRYHVSRGLVCWKRCPDWVGYAVNNSGFVIVDTGTSLIRLTRHVPKESSGTWFAASQMTTGTATNTAYRTPLLDAFDAMPDGTEPGDALHVMLTIGVPRTVALLEHGAIPKHVRTWIDDRCDVDVLLAAHGMAAAHGWRLPADPVNETDFGSWLRRCGRGEGSGEMSLEGWFSKARPRMLLDNAGIPPRVASVWNNSSRDPRVLIEAHRLCSTIDVSLAEVYASNQHDCWAELKQLAPQRQKVSATSVNGWFTRWRPWMYRELRSKAPSA